MNKKVTIGNVCFIIDKQQNKLLLLKRKNPPMQNMYTGVGGKTNFDEDINYSCVREVKEETGLSITNPSLKAVIKTILSGKDSSWILFVYTADQFTRKIQNCDEGQLEWVDINKIYEKNLIGFIKLILPHALKSNTILEGTIWHDLQGKVLKHQFNQQISNSFTRVLTAKKPSGTVNL